jgi:signal transduction histidine kinase
MIARVTVSRIAAAARSIRRGWRRANPEVSERFSRIREQAERAAALTRELLAFARRQVLQPRAADSPTTLGPMVREMLDQVKS